MKRPRQLQPILAVFADISTEWQPLGHLQAHSCLHPLQKHLSDHPDIGQGKQGHKLCGVLDQPAVTHLAVTELAFDHPEWVFHFGAHTGLELLSLFTQRPPGRVPLLLAFARAHSNVPVHARGLISLGRTLVTRVSEDNLLLPMQQCMSLGHIVDVGNGTAVSTSVVSFVSKVIDLTVEIEAAIQTVVNLIKEGYSCQIGFSGGKDSSTVALLCLEAIRRCKVEGVRQASLQVDELSEEALLAELGVSAEKSTSDNDITVLRRVRTSSERREAEDIADRTPCKDFPKFKPLFEQAERELGSKVRIALRFGRDATIQEHDFFILEGQFAYVAEMGETIKMASGHNDARLRVIYSNGTESNLLLRSLQKALWKDDTGRRLTSPSMGPLFSDEAEPEDIETGTIYVLRSLSTHPYVTEHRELIHKIGVTGGKVETRISGADKDATYLLASVEVVATYKLHNINRVRMENLFHRIFSSAQIDISIDDRFGNPGKPREWFLVPLHVIDEAVKKIRDGSITEVYYDTALASLVKRK